VFDYSIYFL